MFINYFAHSTRPTAFNILVVRILVGLYIIWKLLSYDWEFLQEWPIFLYEEHRYGILVPFTNYLDYLAVQKWVTVFLLVCFTIGLWVGPVSFLSALSIAHMTALHYVVTNSAATFLPPIYILIFFGIFRKTDRFSLDNVLKTGNSSRKSLKKLLLTPGSTKADMAILKWALVVVALTYFFTGYSKLVNVGLVWSQPENLILMIQRDAIMHLNGLPLMGSFIVENRWLALISTLSTLILECGFIFAVLLRLSVTPFIIGLAGMHAVIALAMGIFFFDQYILYLLFVPWDQIFKITATAIENYKA